MYNALEHLSTESRLRRNPVVQTWCRICGKPAVFVLHSSYERTRDHLLAISHQPMQHVRGGHSEWKDWGLHYRFDDVLVALFPGDHHEELWPEPPWYEHHMSVERPVRVLSTKEVLSLEDDDTGRRSQMALELVRSPATKEELQEHFDLVLERRELEEAFVILSYMPPFVLVRNRQTGEMGSFVYQDNPRLFWGFNKNRVL